MSSLTDLRMLPALSVHNSVFLYVFLGTGYFEKNAHLLNPPENIAPASPRKLRLLLGFNVLGKVNSARQNSRALHPCACRTNKTLQENLQMLLGFIVALCEFV